MNPASSSSAAAPGARRRTLVVPTVALSLLGAVAHADFYRYQDDDGEWHYTDVPRPGAGGAPEVVDVGHAPSRGSRAIPDGDLEAFLVESSEPVGAVEHATLAVMKVQTDIGSGSGFFVSSDGLIVTSKHVVRPLQAVDWDAIGNEHSAAEKRLARRQKDLRTEARQIERYREEIEERRRRLERKGGIDAEYFAAAYERHRDLKAAHAAKESALDRELRALRASQSAARSTRLSAHSENSFTVVLKDETELEADLVRVSEEHDLALLRLRGRYKTPALRAADPGDVFQGGEVFAIGSPLGLSDYVTRGIITRREDERIVTDAQILPGSSGGPLITPDGKVVGLNTEKVLAEASAGSEGFGWAIPYRVLLEEFGQLIEPGARD